MVYGKVRLRMPRQIHQILPFLTFGDAIGNLVFELRQLLREWGYTSEIFAENWDRRLAKECHSYRDYSRYSHSGNILILHFSTGGQVNQFVKSLPDRVIIYYHNVTPAHYFYWANGALAQELKEARRDLESLVRLVPAICDSPYNQQELETMGFRTLGVVPPIFSFAHLRGAARTRPEIEKQDSVDWLHVGRLAPNKCVQDVIKAFYYFHTWIIPHSRLFLVGSGAEMQPYVDDLHILVSRLGLGDSVVFTGRVDRLAPFYQIADVYVTMSEHEGFCIPLVEAMYCDVPVLAYASAGIPSTLGDAGVLVHSKAYSIIAEMAEQLIVDEPLRRRLIQVQRSRFAVFAPDVVRAQFRECLDRAVRL